MQKVFDSPIKAKVQALIYDCENPDELATFYARLLGGTVEMDPYGGYGVAVTGLNIELGFQQDEQYQKPVWLGPDDAQQPMLHIDIAVENRQQAVDYAVSIGATLPERQFCQPEWDVQWTTMLDPAGHPFCLFEASCAGFASVSKGA